MVGLSRRLILWIGAGAVGFVLLAVAALAVAVLVIDPNRFKDRIAQAVQDQTGRTLTLAGDLGWRVFPWLVVNAGAGSLGNPAGFVQGEFVRWQGLRLGVKLLPLLHKQLVIDRVRVDGADLHLQRNAQGVANWSFASGKPANDMATPLQIDSLELRNGTLRYADAGSGTTLRVTALDVAASLPAGSTTRDIRVEKLQLSAVLQASALGEASNPVTIAADEIVFAADALSVPKWQGSFGPAKVSGSITANFGEQPTARGTFELQTDALRELLRATGNTPPRTADPHTLGRFELATRFDYARDAASFDALRVRLDDTQLAGSASLIASRMVIDMQGDGIDLDRYLEPDDAQSKPLELPLAQLKALQVQGEIRLRQASVSGALLQGVRLKLVSQ
ncbi:MAG: AsmA family protein [Steroidobacteraceae bacterium]